MGMIAMAIFDTPENQRSELTRRTLESLLETVDFNRHRIFLVVNGSTPETYKAISAFKAKCHSCTIIDVGHNIGTARAINKAWAHRQPGEMCIKMDNDVVIHRAGWVDEMEECIERLPRIGIIGLKRKDLEESPTSGDMAYRSTLHEIPHKPGQNNLYIEVVKHVMGTCQAYNPALLDRIGYLCQPGIYGFDDSLAGIRCKVAGYLSCFLLGVQIDHLDPPNVQDMEYTKWKRGKAGEDSPEFHRLEAGYLNGTIGIRYDADGNNVPEKVQPTFNYVIR